jgi:hypothetical protein
MNLSTYEGSFTDNGNPPPGDLFGSPNTVVGEVCSVLGARHVSPSGSAVYLVYSTTPADSLCGWHTHGSCGSTPIFFGYILNADNNHCSSVVPIVGGHSAGPSGIANTTAQHLSAKGCVPAAPWSHVVTWFTRGNNPSQATIQQYCTWTANASGGTAPYTYTWQSHRHESVRYPERLVGELRLTVKDPKAQQATTIRPVYMTSFRTSDCSTVP